MTIPLCKNTRQLYTVKTWFTYSTWNGRTLVHRALTSAILITFGMNWKTECAPSILSWHWQMWNSHIFGNLVEILVKRVEIYGHDGHLSTNCTFGYVVYQSHRISIINLLIFLYMVVRTYPEKVLKCCQHITLEVTASSDCKQTTIFVLCGAP